MFGTENLVYFFLVQNRDRAIVLIDGHQSDYCLGDLIFVFAPTRFGPYIYMDANRASTDFFRCDTRGWRRRRPVPAGETGWSPWCFWFQDFFNNCKGGQHIPNRGSDHTGQHNCTCHGTSFAVVGAERIAAVRVPLPPRLSRKLPAAKSSHRYGDCVHGNNNHDFLLNTVVADGSALMAHSSIGKKVRNDQRSWMSARVTW